MHKRLRFGLTMILLLCLIGTCADVLWGFPSSKLLGRWYFARILAGDVTGAVALSGSHCRPIMTEDATHDVARFGGAIIRNVTYMVNNGSGSDDTAEIVTIQFEYQKGSETPWQIGTMRLISYGSDWNIRSLCGNLIYHGP